MKKKLPKSYLENKRLFLCFITMLIVLNISQIAAATTIIMNIDARVNGDPSWGFPSVDVYLEAGDWLLSPTNPSLDPQALYYGWSFGTAGFDNWENVVHVSTSTIGGFNIGRYNYNSTGFTSPQQAFYDSSNQPVNIHLSVPDTLRFYFQDNYLADNAGGVSIKISGNPLSTVPEPTTSLLFGFGLAGLAGITGRKTKK